MVPLHGSLYGRALADSFNPRAAACDTSTGAVGRHAGGLAIGRLSSDKGKTR
jgi:hypothetical protein